jgi:hypothetical protein
VVSPVGAAPARAAPAPAGGRTGPPGLARATVKRRQTAAGRGVSTPSGRAARAASPESGAAASPPAPLSARLSRGDRLRLAGRLYQRLREFAFGPVGASAYQAALKQAFGASPAPPGTSSRIDFDDWYLFEGGSGHWSTVGLFIYTHRDLTADELALLHAWYTTRRRAYRVRAAGPGSLDLVDVASGARRTVREAHLVPLPYLGAGETVEARVLPAGGDTWFLSDAVFVARRG